MHSSERNGESRPISTVSEGKLTETPSNASTIPAGLSKEEITSMNQIRAFEILGLTYENLPGDFSRYLI